MERMFTSGAAHLMRQMIVSCGSTGCVATMKLLESVTEDVPYDSIAKIEGFGYRLKAFERLDRYANEHNLQVIDAADVALYFGGQLHIEIMSEHASHAGLARFLGEAAGLVTHILLPLEGNVYSNAGHSFSIKNAYEVNPGSEGTPYFHLGLIVRLVLPDEVRAEILRQQASSQMFVDFLSEIEGEVNIPEEYYYALNCLATQ